MGNYHEGVGAMSDLVKELNDLWFNIQKELKPSISIEAGAFKAEFSQKMKNLFPDVEAWAFEANPHTYEQEVDDLIDQDICYIRSALSNTVGTIDFLIQEAYMDGDKVVSLIDPIRGNNSTIMRTEKGVRYNTVPVPCTTLDAVFVETKEPTCLWIDVEGASDKVLSGAVNMLENVQSIFIEVETFEYWKDQWLASDVTKFLEDRGFLFIAHDNEYEKQHNRIFVRQELMPQIEGLVLHWEDHYN
jgi:FkbM family methyltransferase